jgi:hypothetical protein
MAVIILGKNLITEDELIEFAFSEGNHNDLPLRQLHAQASEAALLSSWLLIRIMKAERIYISHKPALGTPPQAPTPPTFK